MSFNDCAKVAIIRFSTTKMEIGEEIIRQYYQLQDKLQRYINTLQTQYYSPFSIKVLQKKSHQEQLYKNRCKSSLRRQSSMSSFSKLPEQSHFRDQHRTKLPKKIQGNELGDVLLNAIREQKKRLYNDQNYLSAFEYDRVSNASTQSKLRYQDNNRERKNKAEACHTGVFSSGCNQYKLKYKKQSLSTSTRGRGSQTSYQHLVNNQYSDYLQDPNKRTGEFPQFQISSTSPYLCVPPQASVHKRQQQSTRRQSKLSLLSYLSSSKSMTSQKSIASHYSQSSQKHKCKHRKSQRYCGKLKQQSRGYNYQENVSPQRCNQMQSLYYKYVQKCRPQLFDK